MLIPIMVLIPLLSGVLLAVLPRASDVTVRAFAVMSTVITFVISLGIAVQFNSVTGTIRSNCITVFISF